MPLRRRRSKSKTPVRKASTSPPPRRGIAGRGTAPTSQKGSAEGGGGNYLGAFDTPFSDRYADVRDNEIVTPSRKDLLFSEAKSKDKEKQPSPGDANVDRSLIGKIFIEYIPTYVCGAKAFLLKGKEYTFIGVFWVVYMIYVMQRLLAFLDFYYLHNGYGNKEIQKLTDFYRYCIAFSYLVIDLIYPVSFVMLYLFYQTGILEKSELHLFIECGQEDYKRIQSAILRNYILGITFVVIYCIFIWFWLGYTNGLPFEQWGFWVFIFGIPHALYPILLCCHVAHVVRLFDARLEAFREDVVNNNFTSVDEIWDTFFRCRKAANDLSDQLKNVVGIFCITLLFAILFQGAAVFVFEGEIGSLTYMVLNVVTLLWIMGECQQLNHVFSELCEDIIHMPVSSVLGDLNSNTRILFVMAMKRGEAYPYMTAFGFIKFSMENFYNAFILSIGSIGSVVWNLYFEKNMNGGAGTLSKIESPFT